MPKKDHALLLMPRRLMKKQLIWLFFTYMFTKELSVTGNYIEIQAD